MSQAAIFRWVLITLSILALAFLASETLADFDWNAGDYLVAGALLLSAGLGIELIRKRASKKAARTFGIIAVVTTLVVVWGLLATG